MNIRRKPPPREPSSPPTPPPHHQQRQHHQPSPSPHQHEHDWENQSQAEHLLSSSPYDHDNDHGHGHGYEHEHDNARLHGMDHGYSSPYYAHDDDEAGQDAASPFRDLGLQAGAHPHTSLDMPGHGPALSESFYHEAAAALRGQSSPSPVTGGEPGGAIAHLPTLLHNPFEGRMSATPSSPPLSAVPEYTSPPQGSYGENYNYGYGGSGYDEKEGDGETGYDYTPGYAGVAGGGGGGGGSGGMEAEEYSPRSSYDDSREVDTPDPFRTPGAAGGGLGYIPSPYANALPRSMDDREAAEESTLHGPTAFGGTSHDDPYGYAHDYAGSLSTAAERTPTGFGGGGGGGHDKDASYASGLAGAGMDTMHFGPAPARGAQLRRHKTKKNVRLTQGNLVLDCPVPTKLQSFLSRRGEDEFMSMRYTAVTCEPDDFPHQNFTLRPALMNRHTEIFIVVTMYNEDEVLFTRTLHGVMKNIAHLCSRNKSRTWGPEGWKKVVVCIVADGRKKIHPRVLDCLAALGVYQEGVAKNMVNGKVVQAHVYEYTTQLSIDSNLQFKGAERGLVPMQILFCLKEKNAKKINSHRWFFNAFAPILQPNVCVLLDVGTKPENKSIYYLWKSFDLNSNVAGACGEICADTRGKWGVGPALLNPLVAAQNFEYKISNILDKTTESVFGYISVLPGAFSAYRYIALQNDELGHGPLASYFKGESLLGADADVFTSNMYLAEDRILCFELAAKRGSGWVLKYVKSARGVTDVPDAFPEFISQRRRWLNGSFFAGVYALYHTRQFFRSGHGFWRKVALGVESLYSTVNLAFAWFGLANYYIFFRILTKSLEDKNFKLHGIGVWNTIVQYIYIGTVVSCFIFAMGNRPQGSKWKYMAAVITFALLTVYMFVAAAFCTAKAIGQVHDAVYAQMVVSLLATYGVYLMSSLIACDPMHLLTSFIQYLLLAPTYINVLNIYAFCNLHDFSWGTKGDTTVSNDLGAVVSTGKGTVEVTLPTAQADIDTAYDDALMKLRTRPMIIKGEASRDEITARQMDYYKNIRTNVVLVWALSNGVLAALILNGPTESTFDSASGVTRTKVYMIFILVFVAGMACVRFIGSTAYMLTRLIAG